MTVLVVEDNEDNRRLVFKRLRAAGHHLIEAIDGAQARAHLAEHLPDLVLMDLQLPDASGLDIVKEMRGDDRLKSVVVVACTAFAYAQDREDALAAGCDGYISKPVNIRTLPAQLEAIIEASRG